MIHRYWTGPADRSEQMWSRTIIAALHPRVKIHDWTDTTLPADVIAWLDSKGAEVLSGDEPRHRANLVRWWAMATHGGIWLDHDVIPLLDLRTLPRPWIAGLGRRPSAHAMAFAAGDPIAVSVYRRLQPLSMVKGTPATRASGDSFISALLDGVRIVQPQFDALGRLVNRDAAFVHLWASSRTRKQG